MLDGENEIVWSYSVRWEESEVPWASRWDVYLNMKDVQIHWFSILNSIIVIACLTGKRGGTWTLFEVSYKSTIELS